MPPISRTEFDVLAAQTGLPLSEAQKATLFGIYPTLQKILAIAAAPLPREAEPSLIFYPEVRR